MYKRVAHSRHCVYLIHSVDGFIEKNRDTLWADISRFLHNSSVPMVSELFQSDGALEEGKSAGAGKRPTTLGSQFRLSIAALMNSLSSKNPHYIRCGARRSALSITSF